MQEEYDRYSESLDQMFTQTLQSLDRLAQMDIIFIYDEARALLSKFILIRRALTHFPRSREICNPLTLMTDTTAKISKISPIQGRDPYLRATQMPQGIFSPF